MINFIKLSKLFIQPIRTRGKISFIKPTKLLHEESIRHSSKNLKKNSVYSILHAGNKFLSRTLFLLIFYHFLIIVEFNASMYSYEDESKERTL